MLAIMIRIWGTNLAPAVVATIHICIVDTHFKAHAVKLRHYR
jgi:hypothetical protein